MGDTTSTLSIPATTCLHDIFSGPTRIGCSYLPSKLENIALANMDVKSTERQQESRCNLVKRLLLSLAVTEIQICYPARPLRQRLATSSPNSSWFEVLSIIRSIRPSPRSRADHWLTMNFHDCLDCTSWIRISSWYQEGLFPKLSCPICTPWSEPSYLLTWSTKKFELTRENNVLTTPGSWWLSWRMPLFPSEP